MSAVNFLWAIHRGSRKPRQHLTLRGFGMGGSTVPARILVPVAIAVTSGRTGWGLIAAGRARRSSNVQFHQPFGGKSNHLPRKFETRDLFDDVAALVVLRRKRTAAIKKAPLGHPRAGKGRLRLWSGP